MEYEFVNKGLLVNKKVLAIADVHLGYEDALINSGVLVPKGEQLKQSVEDLSEIFAELGERGIKLEKVVILGDLKHHFGKISGQEWSDTLKFIDFILKQCKEVILLKGNHDKILEPIANKRNLEIKEFFVFEDIFFSHGDKDYLEMLDKKIELIVVGHFHPAIEISDKYKKEKYKCFLSGKWKNKEVIVLPSFISLVQGKEVEQSEEFGISLKLEEFKVHVVGDKVYDFGKLKSLRKLV
ncbi:MAG: metallophosphoesterase [archaeon]